MKIVQTSDIHLKINETERWEVLRWILKKCDKNDLNADILVIAGDLFDSTSDALKLRAKVREVFDEFTKEIWILPGNHDADVYSGGEVYGERVKLLTKPEIIQKNGINIIGIPFSKDKKLGDVLKEIKLMENKTAGGTNILITHGTLIDEALFYIQDYIKHNEGGEYFPIYWSDIKDNDFSYVGLGHFHNYRELSQGVYYSGSPVSIRRSDTDPRYILLLTIGDTTPKIVVDKLNVDIASFWRRVDYFLIPGEEENSLDEIKDYLKKNRKNNLRLDVRIAGFLKEEEKKFQEELNSLREMEGHYYKELQVSNETTSYAELLKNYPVVERFISIFKEEWGKDKDKKISTTALESTLRAFTEVIERK